MFSPLAMIIEGFLMRWQDVVETTARAAIYGVTPFLGKVEFPGIKAPARDCTVTTV
jgi:hypothetical protein